MNEKLFNELKKLSKTANQRILRLERLTGEKETFAVKQLADYLSTTNGLTKSGRVKVSKKLSETEMVNIIKATKEFLSDQYSRIAPVKKLKKEVEKSVGVSFSYKQISTFFTAQNLWDWVDNCYGSDFWKDFAPEIFEMNKTDWVDYAEKYAQSINDKEVKDKLKAIYDYIKKHGLNGVVKI